MIHIKLSLTKEAKKQLKEFKKLALASSKEVFAVLTGGIRYNLSRDDIVIEDIRIVPSKKNTSSYCSYNTKDIKVRNFLGTIHSHPNFYPEAGPSHLDMISSAEDGDKVFGILSYYTSKGKKRSTLHWYGGSSLVKYHG